MERTRARGAGSRAPPRRLEKHGPPVRSRLEKMSQGGAGPGEPEEGQEGGQEEGQGKPGGARWSRGGQPSPAKLKICNPIIPKNLIIPKSFKFIDIRCKVDV